MNNLLYQIKNSDGIERDIAWCILKRKDPKFKIRRKLICLASLFEVNEDEVLDEAAKDEEGWILDFENRDVIHNALIEAARGSE